MGERKRILFVNLQRETRKIAEPLFPEGTVRVTPEALDAIHEAKEEMDDLLTRHITGDWGDVSKEESELNNLAIAEGQEILSAYYLPTGIEVWIVTDAERTFTTLQLPDDIQK